MTPSVIDQGGEPRENHTWFITVKLVKIKTKDKSILHITKEKMGCYHHRCKNNI